MHDPEVLILDEPTSGLDPNQLRDIRSLILELGKEKTVIFSTHIMQEVSALCDRVLIIDRGNLVADDPIETLQARVNSEQQIAVVFDSAIPHDKLKTIDGFKSFVNKGNEYTIIATKDIRKELFHWAVAQKVVIIEMNAIKLSIENVFTELTQQGKNV